MEGKDAVVKRKNGCFCAPEADIDEEETDPRNLEEMSRQGFGYAVVESVWRRVAVLHAQVILPCVDADENAAREPREDNESVSEVGSNCRESAVAGPLRYSNDNGYESNSHECPVKRNEARLAIC